jgi:hypothetical protein
MPPGRLPAGFQMEIMRAEQYAIRRSQNDVCRRIVEVRIENVFFASRILSRSGCLDVRLHIDPKLGSAGDPIDDTSNRRIRLAERIEEGVRGRQSIFVPTDSAIVWDAVVDAEV